MQAMDNGQRWPADTLVPEDEEFLKVKVLMAQGR